MSTETYNASKPYNAVTSASGRVVEVGHGIVSLESEQGVLWFETEQEREDHYAVQEYRRRRVRLSVATQVEQLKTAEEYAGKAENAARWITNNPEIVGTAPLVHPDNATPEEIYQHDYGDYSPTSYPWMSIEVDVRGITPRQCAEEIQAAVVRDDESDIGTLAKARRRVQLREQYR